MLSFKLQAGTVFEDGIVGFKSQISARAQSNVTTQGGVQAVKSQKTMLASEVPGSNEAADAFGHTCVNSLWIATEILLYQACRGLSRAGPLQNNQNGI